MNVLSIVLHLVYHRDNGSEAKVDQSLVFAPSRLSPISSHTRIYAIACVRPERGCNGVHVHRTQRYQRVCRACHKYVTVSSQLSSRSSSMVSESEHLP